jgi:hypothetical protein
MAMGFKLNYEAYIGYNNDNAPNGVGRRRVSIFNHNKWKFLINDFGFFQDN